MNRLTSMADYYARVKEDSRYEIIALTAYRENVRLDRTTVISYDNAIIWIEAWIKNRRNELIQRGQPDNCIEMVNYLNKLMDKIPIFSSKLMSPHTVNTAADDARPQFNGEYLTISGGGGYSRASQEYERLRREAAHNGYVIASQQQRRDTVSYAGTDYEIMEHRYINPVTGLQSVICRQVPLGIPQNIRNEIEEELRLDAEREIQRQITAARRRASWYNDVETTVYDDTTYDDDNEVSFWRPSRRYNEDNPNNDR